MSISATVKLRQRHISEWFELVNTQQAVWQLFREETAKRLSASCGDKVACFYLRKERTAQLAQIMVRQGEVRAQMKERHQQEQADLEQLLASRYSRTAPNFTSLETL